MLNVKRKTSSVKCQASKFRLLVGVVLAFLLLTSNLQLLASNIQPPISNIQSPTPNLQSLPWVEPRSLNITNLVGQVPDDLLRGGIISSYPWDGIVQFESSSVSEDTVVITTTIRGRLHFSETALGCLGQVPRSDEMGSAAPPSHLKVYTPEGSEVTPQITNGYYWPASLVPPLAGTATSK